MTAIKTMSFLTGLLTLVWQAMQIVNGNAKNLFLIPDIILGVSLVAASLLKTPLQNTKWLLLALGCASGVFMTATFGGWLMGTYDFGAFTTTIGLVVCTACAWVLIRRKEAAA